MTPWKTQSWNVAAARVDDVRRRFRAASAMACLSRLLLGVMLFSSSVSGNFGGLALTILWRWRN